MANLFKTSFQTILMNQKFSGSIAQQIRKYSFRYRICSALEQTVLEKQKCPRRPPSTFDCHACADTMSDMDWDLLWERAKTEGTCHIKLKQRRQCAKCPTLPNNLPHCKNISRDLCVPAPIEPFCEKIRCPYKSYSECKNPDVKKRIIAQCDICPKSQHRHPHPPNPKVQCLEVTRVYDPCNRVHRNIKIG